MISEEILLFQSNVSFKLNSMNFNLLKIVNQYLRLMFSLLAIILLGFVAGCDSDDPVKEDVPELITKATLTFTPTSGAAVVVTATDPDGDGVKDIEVDGPINLAANTDYTLSITLINGLAGASDPAYNITEEVEEEGDEHMFFFSWTNNAFSDPAGNGNMDSRADAVNYLDEDENSLPLGLETGWTTGAASSGEFRVVLKHQPELKSATSTSSAGETDLDISFTLNVQ
jgi:hypothetical protein